MFDVKVHFLLGSGSGRGKNLKWGLMKTTLGNWSLLHFANQVMWNMSFQGWTVDFHQMTDYLLAFLLQKCHVFSIILAIFAPFLCWLLLSALSAHYRTYHCILSLQCTSCTLVTWQHWFPSTLKGNDLCQSVRRSASFPLHSLWGVSDYVFCQCVCGNLLICTNRDSNAPATAAFLADGWLGCQLMAESTGPQLGAGNIAHYTFSRGEGGGGNSHCCAACRCRCNHIILNHRSVMCWQSLGSCQRVGWSLIKARPKTKWHVLNLISGDVKQTITYPSRCEVHPIETLSPEWIFNLFPFSFFWGGKLELSSSGAACIFYEGIMANGGWVPGCSHH